MTPTKFVEECRSFREKQDMITNWLKIFRHWVDEHFPGAEHPMVCSPMAVTRNPRWEREAKEWLEGKVCAACGGKDHLQVHHAEIPVHFPGGKEREMDKTQWMPLCMAPAKLCHLLIGHSGDFRAFNPHAREDANVHYERIRDRVYPDNKPCKEQEGSSVA